MKFKSGDKVRFITKDNRFIEYGRVDVVCEDDSDVYVSFNGEKWTCQDHELELVKESKKIKIKYHYPDQPKLKKVQTGNWIDLYTAEDVYVTPFKRTMINLGISMQLPEGYEANIVPRSSTFKHFNLIQTNHYGVIDDSYQGNDDIWHMSVIYIPEMGIHDCLFTTPEGKVEIDSVYFEKESIFIPKHTRLCQFRINEIQPDIEFEEVEFLDGENRGGFGSTGK